jgi:hypothetical protein
MVVEGTMNEAVERREVEAAVGGSCALREPAPSTRGRGLPPSARPQEATEPSFVLPPSRAIPNHSEAGCEGFIAARDRWREEIDGGLREQDLRISEQMASRRQHGSVAAVVHSENMRKLSLILQQSKPCIVDGIHERLTRASVSRSDMTKTEQPAGRGQKALRVASEVIGRGVVILAYGVCALVQLLVYSALSPDWSREAQHFSWASLNILFGVQGTLCFTSFNVRSQHWLMLPCLLIFACSDGVPISTRTLAISVDP